MLHPVFGPFDGPIEFERRERNDNFFRIQCAFRAKASADIGRHDAYTVLVPAEMVCNQAAHHVRRLRRGPNSHDPAERIDCGDDAPTDPDADGGAEPYTIWVFDCPACSGQTEIGDRDPQPVEQCDDCGAKVPIVT